MKNEAKLNNGEIVEYDAFFTYGGDKNLHPNYIYLGYGIIHSINGEPYPVFTDQKNHFWLEKPK